MLSITLSVMSAILRELALMASMVCTTWVTTSPPSAAAG